MSFNKLLIVSLVFYAILSACNSRVTPSKDAKVQIKEVDGRFTLYRNGEPYSIKGAGGFAHLDVLKEMGGNTIRIWDTVGLENILDNAYANDIAVIVGLPIPDSKGYMSFYNDSLKVSNQYHIFKEFVNKYKSHPAVLMWCIGNELDFPGGLSSNGFYNAFNDLTNMIHEDDPDHPVTTSLMYFGEDYIYNLVFRCNIDVISFNIFGSLPLLRDQLKKMSWFWKGPLIITEWGADGPWIETAKQTAWGVFIEDSSRKKAELVLNRYKDLPIEDSRLLGSFIFYWGHKQEATSTWFSLFDEVGGKSELVSVMNYLWTNQSSGLEFPNLKDMLVDGRGAEDNIILDANTLSNAELLMDEPAGDIKSVKWEIFKEDWALEEGGLRGTKKLPPISHLIQVEDSLKVSFIAPKEEGPYRIFATIYNHEGNFSTCNIPFYVISNENF